MDLTNTYKNILTPIQQGISGVNNLFMHPIQSAAQSVENFIHPQQQPTYKPPVNRPATPGYYPQMDKGSARPALPLVQSYMENQIRNPLQQGSQALLSNKTNILQKGLGGVQAALSPFNATPAGIGFNLGSGAVAGALNTLRTGTPLQQSIPKAITQNPSIAQTGLGIKNPLLAFGVDTITNPGTLATGVKGIDNIAQGIKGLSPNAFSIHPDDQRLLGQIIDTFQTEGKLNPDENKTLQTLTDHYLGQKYSAQSTKKITDTFDAILSNQNGGLKTKIPTVSNLVGEAKPPEVTNPTDPFYNVKRVGVSPEQQQTLKQTVEDIKPQVEQVVGKPLSHQEVVDFAKNTSKVLDKTIGRQQTLEMGASNLNLRNQIAQMAQSGKVTPEFIDALTKDKAMGENIARLLGQRAITSSTEEKPAMQAVIEAVMKKNQNTDAILKAAQGVDFNDPKQAAAFYRQFVKPNASDWLDLIRYNSMLSSPNTLTNIGFGSALNTAVVAPIEHTVTGAVDYLSSKITGNPQQHFLGEGAAYTKGYYSKLGDAAHNLADVIRGKQLAGVTDVERTPIAVTGKAGQIVSHLSFFSNLHNALYKFFSTLTEGGETGALKYAESKGANVGNIEAKAKSAAAYRTFRQELGTKGQGYTLGAIDELGQKIQQLRNSSNPVASTIAKFSMPFLTISTNMVKQGLEYSPAGFSTIPGAADKTAQFSKALMGTAGAAAAMMMVTSGRTTWGEPTSPNKKAAFRAAGMQPYSVKIGNNWYSYSKLPPAMAVPLAITSAIHEAQQNKTINQSQVDAILSGISQMPGYFSDQSFLKNIGDAIASVKGDPEKGVSNLVGNYAQQLIPYRALLGWLARLTDPYQRKVDTNAGILQQQVQQILTQIPVASTLVPARTDQSGQPIANQKPGVNALSPVKVTTENPQNKQVYDLMNQQTQNTRNGDAIKKMILQGKDVTGFTQAGAADQSQINPQQQLKNQMEEKIARQKVKLQGTTQQVNNKVIYNDNGKVKSIDTNNVSTPPISTGNKELDNAQMAKYKASVNAKITNVTNLYKIGQLSASDAEKQIENLKSQEQQATSKTLTPPTLTGNTELDKALVAKYKGEVATHINDVVAMYNDGKITASQAEQQIQSLKTKAGTRVGTGRTKVYKIKTPVIKIPKAKAIKVKSIKPVKQYSLKPIKVSSLTRSTKKGRLAL